MNIVRIIVNIPFVLDFIIGIFLIISTSIGFNRGFWRGLWRLLFVAIALLISWYFLLPSVATFIRDGFLNTCNITFEISEEHSITSIGELIKYLSEVQESFGVEIDPRLLDPVYLDAFILSFCKSFAWLLLVMIIEFISWIVSGLLYLILIRLIIPANARSHKLKFLGALCGLLQGVVITFAFMLGFSTISPAMKSISNAGVAGTPYGWLPEPIRLVIAMFDPNDSMLEPYVGNLENSLVESGLHVIPEGYERELTLKEEMQLFFEETSWKLENTTEEETPETPEETPEESVSSEASEE